MVPFQSYMTKPVVIHAMRYDGTKECREYIVDTIAKQKPACPTPASVDANNQHLTITTLEGNMLVSPGDYVIRGLKGEYYPCKPDVFDAKYALASVPHAIPFVP